MIEALSQGESCRGIRMKIGKWILERLWQGQTPEQEQKYEQKQSGEFYFDRENQKPVLRSSICTGEQVVGFKDLRTGKFTDIMLVRDNKDMEEFTRKYGISREEITREW